MEHQLINTRRKFRCGQDLFIGSAIRDCREATDVRAGFVFNPLEVNL